jgi:ketosteroid isomerase-like protein
MKNQNNAAAAGRRACSLYFAIALTLLSAACSNNADDPKAATELILQQIEKYTAALDGADIDLASQVWRTSGEISFIHPAGHAHRWEEVKGFYSFFGSAFSERKLTVRDVAVHVNGDNAWVEFYWHFVAKNKDGSPIETDGRESQVYEKAGSRWQLVHVHYSGQPMVASQ